MARARRRSAISFFRWTTFPSRRYDRSKFELEMEMHLTAATAPRIGSYTAALRRFVNGCARAASAPLIGLLLATAVFFPAMAFADSYPAQRFVWGGSLISRSSNSAACAVVASVLHTPATWCQAGS